MTKWQLGDTLNIKDSLRHEITRDSMASNPESDLEMVNMSATISQPFCNRKILFCIDDLNEIGIVQGCSSSDHG